MKRIYAFLLPFALSGLLFGQAKQDPKQKPLVFIHVTVIDATGAPAKSDMTVVIADDRISELGQTGKILIPKDAQVVDAAGKFLIPGLWDMHVHTWYPDVAFPTLFVANGVTGIRDVHGPWDHFEKIKQWRQDIASGKIIGPRILAAGPLVDGPKSAIKPQHLEVANPSAGREAVDTLKRRGADLVKVYDWLSRDSYYAVVDEAKNKGMPYTGHIPYAISGAEASRAGQDIEHLLGILLSVSTREAELRQALVEGKVQQDAKEMMDTFSKEAASNLFATFAKNGTWVTPTLVIVWKNLKAFAQDDPDFIARNKYIPVAYREATHPILKDVPRLRDWGKWDPKTVFHTSEEVATQKARFEKYLEIVGGMRRAGVRLMAGTDTGAKAFLVPGFSLHDELFLLVQAGLTPMEALQAGTRNPAEHLGLADKLGTVQQGKIADLILLDADPLQEIRNTQKIAAVVVGGKFISKSSLQQMLTEVQAAAGRK